MTCKKTLTWTRVTSSCSAEQYEEVLEELEKKVLDGCKQEGRIPIIGADINGSVGISKAEDEEEEGSNALRTSPIGPYGLDRPTNRNGTLFTSFMANRTSEQSQCLERS